MARRHLKVFRTSIGFQDAYVATASQKAALEVWGTSKDLFSAGLAERVDDPALTKAALARPGEVIRVAKGTAAQHLAAAGKRLSQPKKIKQAKAKPIPADPPKVEKPASKPKRTKRDRAEAALESATASFAERLVALDKRIKALSDERDAVRHERDSSLSDLEARRASEEAAYREALERWKG